MATLLDSYRGYTGGMITADRRLSNKKILGKPSSNVIQGSVSGLARVGAFLFTIFGGLQGIWSAIVNSAFAIMNFNWRATDDELDANIRGLQAGFAAILGGTLGNAAGWLTCGIIPGSLIYAFNVPLGVYVLKNVGEEALEELIGNASALARYTFLALTRSFVYNIYKGARKFFFANENAFTRGFARAFGIDYDEAKKNYLAKKSGRHWSFASRWEEYVDNIDDIFIRNFIEEFAEEFTEGCIEAGFVVAYSVESWIALQKLHDESTLGNEYTVEVKPDRSTGETIVLSGRESLLKQQIVQVVTDHQVLDKRDVGTIVAIPTEDYLLAKPKNGLRIVVTLTSNKTPPFSNAATRVQIEIPDLNRSALDWERIKFAVGGENGYTWGRFFATAFFESGRRIRVHAITAGEAVDRIKLLLPLIDSTLRTITTGEEAKEGERLLYPSLQKDPVIVYPAFMTVFNRVELLETQRNLGVRNIRTGKKYEMREEQIPLWVPRKPSNWESVTQNLLNRGTNGV